MIYLGSRNMGHFQVMTLITTGWESSEVGDMASMLQLGSDRTDQNM